MITLFVVQSCADAKDPSKTIESFGDIVDDVHCVKNLDEINGTDRGDWYAVIYDDERIEDQLKEGLKVFIEHTEADALVLFKRKEDKFFRSPRVFRRHITLRVDSLMPEQDAKFETILNGWVDSES